MVAVFPFEKTSVDIINTATGLVVCQHEVEGTLLGYTSVQRNIAAMVVSQPKHGVRVMDIKSGLVMFEFTLPNGRDARVMLSKDTFTLVVGSSTGKL